MRSLRASLLALAGLLVLAVAGAQQPVHQYFRLTLGPAFTQPVSGRALIFLQQGTSAEAVDQDPFSPKAVFVAAHEVPYLAPGASVDIDADELAFPAAFSTLPAGNYVVQAILDTGHTYAYSGRGQGDIASPVVPLKNFAPGHAPEPQLTLSVSVPAFTPAPGPAAFEQHAREEQFVSPALSAFFGRALSIHATVVLPPAYSDQAPDAYPTVYWTHGFGAPSAYTRAFGAIVYKRMSEGKMPPMIWVMLDESGPTGTHEFADSLNNGPWGRALTAEFIPYLESKYRMDARVSGRFLQGHSSGGWATLQLQVNYPKVFGGTWSTSPDPSDFHDFTGIDLYAPHANVYRRTDGTPYPLVRNHGKVLGTFEEFTRTEQVLGNYGGQIGSIEWVFSPRGPDGRPLPLFNRVTGDVDPAVVAYWRDHFDLAHIAAADWANRGADLRGKIHVFVGTADTFYLDGPAHRFEAVLQSLGAEPHFTYIPDRTHFDLYATHTPSGKDDRQGLLDRIAAEMYAVARPGSGWRSAE